MLFSLAFYDVVEIKTQERGEGCGVQGEGCRV